MTISNGERAQPAQRLFQATRDGEPSVSVIASRSIGAEGAADERWLQRILGSAAGSEILRGVIAPLSPYHNPSEAWHVLGMEQSVPGIGAIDVLYVTGSGRPVIAETKLARNPEKRREVIAQVAEYALGLKSLKASDLVDPAEADEELADLLPTIERHLRAGAVDLVVVGDAIDDRAIALGQYLINSDPTNQMSVWLVEIGLYQPVDSPSTRIIVPSLRQASVAEIRHVIDVSVKVEATQPSTAAVAVREVSSATRQPTSRGEPLTRDALLRQIEEFGGRQAMEVADQLLNFSGRNDLHVGMRQSGASIRIASPDDPAKRLTMFVITKVATFYVAWLDRWEQRGVPPQIAERYLNQLTDKLGRSPEGFPAQPSTGVPLELFRDRTDDVMNTLEWAVGAIRDAAVKGSG